jgi:hypothetical protein
MYIYVFAPEGAHPHLFMPDSRRRLRASRVKKSHLNMNSSGTQYSMHLEGETVFYFHKAVVEQRNANL